MTDIWVKVIADDETNDWLESVIFVVEIYGFNQTLNWYYARWQYLRVFMLGYCISTVLLRHAITKLHNIVKIAKRMRWKLW